MNYSLELKQLVGRIRFAQKTSKLWFKTAYRVTYAPFLQCLIDTGVIYSYFVSEKREVFIFVKPSLRNKFIEKKAFKHQKYTYRYIKKKLCKLTNAVILFTTDRGIINNSELWKYRLGGQHLITV